MIKVTVCIGSSCHLKGSRSVVEELERLTKVNGLQADIELGGAFCMGKCGSDGVSVTVDGEYFSVNPEYTEEFFENVIVKKANGGGL